LVVTHEQLQANIYFSGGQWLGAERVGTTHVLAQQLVRAGLITAEQFEGALGVAFVHAGSISDAQAIRGLIAARLLSQEQLRAFALHDATSLLAVMLVWNEGDFIFEDGVGMPQGRVAVPLAIGPLVAQAVRLARPAPPSREAPSLSLDTIVDFAEVDPKSGLAIEVSRDQWRLLTMVDGQLPLWAIAEALQAPEALILRLANELLAAGYLVVAGRMAAAAAH
jgi:hypothetical protein